MDYAAQIQDAIGRLKGFNNSPQASGLPGALVRENELISRGTQKLTEGMNLDEARTIPQAIFDPGKYGDILQMPITIPANTSILALQRSVKKRIFLLVENPTGINLYFAFDTAASIVSNYIPPGGIMWFDAAVPQNNLYLFSGPAPVVVPISFMVADMANAR